MKWGVGGEGEREIQRTHNKEYRNIIRTKCGDIQEQTYENTYVRIFDHSIVWNIIHEFLQYFWDVCFFRFDFRGFLEDL